jgi:uncharacterized repeat protein (TIGR01451 family)
MNAILLRQRSLPALLALAWTGAALAQGGARVADAAEREPAAEAAASTDRQAPGVSTDRTGSTRRPGAGSVSVPGIGDLPAGKTLKIVFRASVDAGPFAAGKNDLSNQGTFTGTNIPSTPTDDPDTGTAGDPTLTPLDAQPDLQLAVSDGGASTVPGGTVAYTLSFANNGSQGASGVTLATVVPAHTTFNPGASSPGWTCVPNNNAGSACTLVVGGLSGGGASGSAAFAVTVIDPVPAGVTQIADNASISDDSANGPDPTPGNNSAGDTTPLTAQPDIALTKSDGGATATPGGTLAYTLTYSNVGNQGATGIVLTDVVPADTTFNPGASTAGWACVPDNNPGSTCTLAIAGELAGGGASGNATFAVDVVSPVPAGVTQISNSASAADDGSNGADPVPGNNTGSDTTPINAAPDLSVAKSDGGATAVPGATVAYTLDYANTGTRGATGVVLTETVPAHTTFNPGASTAGWACVPDNNPGSICTLAIGAVPASGGGSSGTATFAVTVANPVASGVTQISNTASVADDGTNGGDPTPGNNTAGDTTPVDAAPDFTLTKSDGGATVAPGGTVTYTLGYANAGNQNAVGVVLTETVPASTTFNPGASTAGWVCVPDNNAGSTCTLAIGALNGGGASGSATFAVTVTNPVPAGVTQISNTASAADDGSNGPDPTPANNSGSDTTPVDAAPDLSVTKSDGGATVVPGGTVAYTLNYANPGNQNATGVVLTETVPASTTFNPGASTAGWVCVPDNNAGSTCTLAVGALNGAGASGTATFAVTVVNPAPAGLDQISNTASVADDGNNGPDPNTGNNTGSDTTPVTATPDLTLTKDDGGVTVNTGGTVAYTLGYANAGNQGATGVVLTETVPANTTFNAGASTAGWVCVPDINAGSTCTLAIAGELAGGGASGSATFAVTVNASVPSGVTQISNTASVADDGTNGPDANPGDNSAGDTTPLVAVPDLTLTLTDNRIAAHAGQVLTYVLTYRNVGSQDATGVELSDVVPLGSTFFDPPGTSGWSCAHGAPAGTNCTLGVPGTVVAGAPAATRNFRVKVDNPIALGTTILNNEASVTDDGSNGPDGNPGNNSAVDTNTIVTPKGDMNRPASREVRATNIARTDLIFQNVVSGRVVVWFMDSVAGVNTQGGGNFTTPLAPAAGFRVVGADDLNDDGLTDLVFRNDATGALQAWFMDGMIQSSVPALPPGLDPGAAWRLEATGDFDSDGRADLLWRDTAAGTVEVSDGLTANPRTVLGNAPVVPDPWRIVGGGQFNLASDSNADLLAVNTSTGALQAWLLDGNRQVASVAALSPATVPAGWDVVAVGDYNVDNQADIILRSPLSGNLVTWFMNGTTRVSGSFTSPSQASDLNWRVVGPR